MGEKKHVVLQHVDGYAFLGKGASNHYVVIDSVYGGRPAASSGPMEMVLMALGACSGSDVVEILRKKRQKVRDLKIELTGKRAEEHPRVYTHIHMRFVVDGEEVDTVAVERAIDLSLTKYCSVHGMLSKVVHISHEYQINESSKR